MNIEKCRTCKNFDEFFFSCDLYVREVYLDEGEFLSQPVSIREIDEEECTYDSKKNKGEK